MEVMGQDWERRLFTHRGRVIDIFTTLEKVACMNKRKNNLTTHYGSAKPRLPTP